MFYKQMLLVPPVLMAVGIGGRSILFPTSTHGSDRRIVDAHFLELEAQLGHHLYAPTWLPYGGKPGEPGVVVGKYRILEEFDGTGGQSVAYLAQEPRSPERDAYNRRVFARRADAKAMVNGEPAYFITGSTGERRLFWNKPDAALIVSSPGLTDGEMIKVAEQVQ